MKTSHLFFYGYQGEVKEQMSLPPKFPLIEMDSAGMDITKASDKLFDFTCQLSFTQIQLMFGSMYRDWGRFGYLGDVIAIEMIEADGIYFYRLDYIGRLAINKPGLAADLIPIIKTSKDDYYFVGVKRKYSPGKGQPALMGGFIDVNGYHLDTPLETVIHEAEEEIGLKIKVVNPNDLLEPLPARVNVNVNYQEGMYGGNLVYLKTFLTGENENMRSLGLKRVYQTSVYVLVINMHRPELDEKGIREWLRAGDDADDLVIFNLKDRQNFVFGLDHHRKIFSSFMEYFVGGEFQAPFYL